MEPTPYTAGETAQVPVGPILPLLEAFTRYLRSLRSLPERAADGSLTLWYVHQDEDSGETSHGGEVYLWIPAEAVEALGRIWTARVGPALLVPLLVTLLAAHDSGRPWYPSSVVALARPKSWHVKGRSRQQLVNLANDWADLLRIARLTVDLRMDRPCGPEHLDAVPLTAPDPVTRGRSVKLDTTLREMLACKFTRSPAALLQVGTLTEAARQVDRGGRKPTGAVLLSYRLAALRFITLRRSSSSRRPRIVSVRELARQAGGIDVDQVTRNRRWRPFAADLIAELDAAGMLREVISPAPYNADTLLRLQAPAKASRAAQDVRPAPETSSPTPASNVVDLAPYKAARAATRRTRARPRPRAVVDRFASQGGR